MKKILLIHILTFTFSCSNKKNDIPKPAKPIDKAVMENILYDLALLQALKSFSPEKLKENSINPKTYIYQKYKIDSLQFAQNNKYYAVDIEDYSKMFERVTNRILAEKTVADTINNREVRLKTKKYQDSIAKNSKATGKNKKDRILVSG